MLLLVLNRVASRGGKERLGKKIAILVGRLGEGRTNQAFNIIFDFQMLFWCDSLYRGVLCGYQNGYFKRLVLKLTVTFIFLKCTFLVPPLFSSDLSRDVSQTAQCKQTGVTNCRAVTINLELLETAVTPGDEINFISGVDLSMQVGDGEEDNIFSS